MFSTWPSGSTRTPSAPVTNTAVLRASAGSDPVEQVHRGGHARPRFGARGSATRGGPPMNVAIISFVIPIAIAGVILIVGR